MTHPLCSPILGLIVGLIVALEGEPLNNIIPVEIDELEVGSVLE